MIFRSFALLVLALGSVACGMGTDPLTALGDPNERMVDTMTLPYNTSLTTPSGFSAYTASSSSLGMGLSFGSTALQILAPRAGVVTQMDATSLTILHNARVSSYLSGISGISVRVGDYVSQGALVASPTSGLSVSLRYIIYVDGSSVCPYSYLLPASKTVINNLAAGTGPCRE